MVVNNNIVSQSFRKPLVIKVFLMLRVGKGIFVHIISNDLSLEAAVLMEADNVILLTQCLCKNATPVFKIAIVINFVCTEYIILHVKKFEQIYLLFINLPLNSFLQSFDRLSCQ